MYKRLRSGLEHDSKITQDQAEPNARAKKRQINQDADYRRACNHLYDPFDILKNPGGRYAMEKLYKVGDSLAAVQNQKTCQTCRFFVETLNLLTPDRSYRIYSRDPEYTSIFLKLEKNPWYSRAGITSLSKGEPESCPYAWFYVGKTIDQPLICISLMPKRSVSQPVQTLIEIYPKQRYEVEAFNGTMYFKEIGEWLKICDNNHTDKCKRDKTELPRGFRLYDVTDRRVKPYESCLKPGQTSGELEYLTLSYVWGPQGWGSFKPFPIGDRITGGLPQVIMDAVNVTIQLDHQYLWVDLLCINQADETELEYQLSHMDQIYASSWLTIVGVDGPDWNHGLKAISTSMVQTQQPSLVTSRGELMATYVHPQSDYDGKSAWDQRAFTLQERLLSRRCLLFADTYCAMQCKTELFHDLLDVFKKPRHTFNLNQFVFRGDGSGIDLDGPSWSFNIYARLVSAYTRRKITKQADVEKACRGALGRISQKAGVNFHFGLPEQDLLRALLWTTGSESTHKRRDGFPSWSWLGWEGISVYPRWMHSVPPAASSDQISKGHTLSATSSRMAELHIGDDSFRQTTRSPRLEFEAGQLHMNGVTICKFAVQRVDSMPCETGSSYPWALMISDRYVKHYDVGEDQELVENTIAFRLDLDQSSHVLEESNSQLYLIFIKSWQFKQNTNGAGVGTRNSNQKQSNTKRRVKRGDYTMISALVASKVRDTTYHRLASVMISEEMWLAQSPGEEERLTLV